MNFLNQDIPFIGAFEDQELPQMFQEEKETFPLSINNVDVPYFSLEENSFQ